MSKALRKTVIKTVKTTLSEKAVRNAALLGTAAGLRSMTPLAALAHREHRVPDKARYALLVAAGGELIADKLPSTPSRLKPPVLAGRIATGAIAGAVVAGPVGGVVGGASALASTYAGYHVRKFAGAKTGLPDPALAVVEYGAAVALAVAGSKRPSGPLGPLLHVLR